jgi:uncharacterized protein
MITIISYARLLLVLFTICLCPMISNVSAADVTQSRRANIEKLLDITGALKNGRAMTQEVTNQMIDTLKAKRPNTTSKELEDIRVAANSVISERFPELIDVLIPIYEKYYTDAEIKALIKFYSSDLGKKLINVMPMATQESFSAGAAWGKSLESDIVKRLIRNQSSSNASASNEPLIVTPSIPRPYDLFGLISSGKRVAIQTPAMPLRSSNAEPRKRSIIMVLEVDANGNGVAYRQFVTACDFQERKSVMCNQAQSDKRFQFERDVYYQYDALKQAYICTTGCGPHTPSTLTETPAIPISFPNLFNP